MNIYLVEYGPWPDLSCVRAFSSHEKADVFLGSLDDDWHRIVHELPMDSYKDGDEAHVGL